MSTVVPPATSSRTVASTDSAPSPVELRGRLVEHEDAGLEREDAGDRDALALAARQGLDGALAERLDAQALERLADPPVHLGAAQPQVLEPERHLALHGPVDPLLLGVLEDEPDRPGEGPRRRMEHVVAAHADRAGDAPAVEVRDEAVEEPQERGLATAGRPDDQREALLEATRDVAQGRFGRSRVPVAEPADRREAHDRLHGRAGGLRSRHATTIAGSIVGIVTTG